MSGLEFNKVAAGVLISGLVALAIGKVGDALYRPDENIKTRGYAVEVAEAPAETAGESAENEVAEAEVDIAALLAAADPTNGEKLTKKCTACHDFSKGGKNKVGPALWDVIGAAKGHHADFSYSPALLEKGGEWTYENMNAFLTKPKDYIPGTKMAFAGLKKAEDRADLIAYLRTLSDNPKPLP